MADNQTICPFCNDSILIPEEFFGSDVECPSCHKQFFIPKVTEEETVVETEGNDSRTFNCPECGAQNTAQENFFGKLICKGCKKEIEIINEDFIPCPHCGNTIFKKDSTCIYCQRAINEAPTAKKQKKNAIKQAIPDAQQPVPAPDSLEKEDMEMLHTILLLKTVNIAAYFVILVFCVAVVTICIIDEDFAMTRPYIMVILFSTLWTIIFHFLLIWFRGIYKNLVRIRIAAEKMTDLKK